MRINYKDIADNIYFDFDVERSKEFFEVLLDTVKEKRSINKDEAEDLIVDKKIEPNVRKYINKHIEQCRGRKVPPRVSWYGDDKGVLLGRGFYFKNSTSKKRREKQLHALIDEIWEALHYYLTPEQFEEFCSKYFQLFRGYTDFKVTKCTRDDGIDFEGRKEEPFGEGEVLVAGQAKRYKKNARISKGYVDCFWGSVLKEYGSKGSRHIVFVTTSNYNSSARKFAKEKNIILVDGEQIATTLAKERIGIKENKGRPPCFDVEMLLKWLKE